MSDSDIPLSCVHLTPYLVAVEAISPTGDREYWLVDHRVTCPGRVCYWAPHEDPGRLPATYRRRLWGGDDGVPRCWSLATKTGRPCQRRVETYGDRCPHHASEEVWA